MGPSARALVTAIAISTAIAQPARGAEVGLAPDPVHPDSVMLAVSAAPGERNLLTLLRDGGDVVVADAATPLRAGPGCVPTSGGGARCLRPGGPVYGLARVRVDAGDEDDQVLAPGLVLVGEDVFLGGDGNDVITATGRISGGAGDDALTAVGQIAIVDGGDGNDVLRAIATPLQPPRFPAPDDAILLGGAGDDEIYGGRGYTHILAGPGRDFVIAGNGQSWIYGGPGDDRLRGGSTHAYIKGEDGDDRIIGSPWYDRLRGGPGRDTIVAKHGVDDIRGDGGDDRIHATDGLADAVACGPGADVLTGDRRDRRSGCERFEPGRKRSPPPDALSG
jgi:Ca2+-binding RTX toxin-like protein